MPRLGPACVIPNAAQAVEHQSAAIVLVTQRTKLFVQSTIQLTLSAILLQSRYTRPTGRDWFRPAPFR